MSEHIYKQSRSYDKNKRKTGESWMPYRPFFWTLGQIATMMGASKATVSGWCYYKGRSSGLHDPTRLLAINMAPPDEKAFWCVEDREFRRYLRNKGVRLYGPYMGRYADEGPIGDRSTPIDTDAKQQPNGVQQ